MGLVCASWHCDFMFFICFTLCFWWSTDFSFKKEKNGLSKELSFELQWVPWGVQNWLVWGLCRHVPDHLPVILLCLASHQAQVAWASLPLQRRCKTTLYRCLLHPELSAKNISRPYWWLPNLLPTQGSQNRNACSQLPLNLSSHFRNAQATSQTFPTPHFSKTYFATTSTLRQICLHYHKLPASKKERISSSSLDTQTQGRTCPALRECINNTSTLLSLLLSGSLNLFPRVSHYLPVLSLWIKNT